MHRINVTKIKNILGSIFTREKPLFCRAKHFNVSTYVLRPSDQSSDRAAGTYEDMRTGPHHIFRIEGGKKSGYTHSNCQHSLKSKFRKSQRGIISVSILTKNKRK